MPRVTFVKSARKDNPVCSKGESYYWWKFRFGGKHFSLTPPRSSQLTQSEYYGAIRGMCEEIEDIFQSQTDRPETEWVESFCDDIAARIRELGEDQNEKRENMPEGLQEGDTGVLLEERYTECESAADGLDSLEATFSSDFSDDDEDITDEDREEEKNDWLTEVESEMSELVSAAEI